MDDWSGESRGQSSGVVCVVFVGGREEIGRIYVWVGFVVDLTWMIGVWSRGDNRAA